MKLLDRWKMGRAFVKLVRDPTKLDMVFEIADSLEDVEMLERFVAGVTTYEQGASALAEKPRLGRLDLPQLRRLPEGSFGRSVAEFLDARSLDPTALPQRPSTTDDEFVIAHLYETHDLWHVVTNFDTDVAGELGLQAFYMAQLPDTLSVVLLAAGMINTFLYSFDDRERRMTAIARGWLLGRRAKPFFGLRWNELWELPLEEVRARLGLDLDAVDREVNRRRSVHVVPSTPARLAG